MGRAQSRTISVQLGFETTKQVLSLCQELTKAKHSLRPVRAMQPQT